jgi:Sulfotransferase family
MITIIGRGHSGTRAISHALYGSGVFMGSVINESGDMLPPDDLYTACRVMAQYVKHLGGNQWDSSQLHTMPIDPVFEFLVRRYLRHVLGRKEPRGWKLPETTLIYPWIVRMFPDIDYIFWVRDPRDSILAGHLTDDMSDFGVPYDKPADDDIHMKRAISWKYQRDIVRATPPPKKRIEVRFEDFVLKNEETMLRLEAFLGFPMGRVITRPDAVGRWKTSGVDFSRFDHLFKQDMLEQGYLS